MSDIAYKIDRYSRAHHAMKRLGNLVYITSKKADSMLLSKIPSVYETLRSFVRFDRHIAPEQHQVGKAQTQKIESKHINLRTRIKRLMRRTICFSKTTAMHDLVIILFINRYEFGVTI